MQLNVIGSGSSGNCYCIGNEQEKLIVEVGLSFNNIKKALDYELKNVVGALVSHVHSDHSLSALDFAKAGIRVYSNKETIEALKEKNNNLIAVDELKSFNVGNFKVLEFDCVHDVKCSGFLIQHSDIRILFLTDTNYLKYKFDNIDYWLIETNYSEKILLESINKGLNKFVANRTFRSHLSLETAIDILKANDLSNAKGIVLLHLSNSNSNAIEFKDTIEGVTGVQTYVAEKGLEINMSVNPF